jgi:thiol-disulfide isomerase/thioredoxin
VIDRATFLTGAIAAAVSPAPSPTASAFPWDLCDNNPALPYDHPLDITIKVLDGKDFHLRDYRGQAVLLNIFATWCGPCNYEEPHLVAASVKYAPMGFTVIGINDREADDTVRAFRKKYAIPFPIAMDREGGFTRALQVGTSLTTSVEFPVSLFITPAGYLYCYLQGAMSPDEMTYRIEKFLKDAPPVPTPSPSPSPSAAASA